MTCFFWSSTPKFLSYGLYILTLHSGIILCSSPYHAHTFHAQIEMRISIQRHTIFFFLLHVYPKQIMNNTYSIVYSSTFYSAFVFIVPTCCCLLLLLLLSSFSCCQLYDFQIDWHRLVYSSKWECSCLFFIWSYVSHILHFMYVFFLLFTTRNCFFFVSLVFGQIILDF